MALIVLWREMVYAFSIGDSRIYRCHNNGLEQVSEDQTLAIKKLKANIYTEEEARNSPDTHRITSYIGLDNRGVGVPHHAYEPFLFAESILLLCSDGLTDMCTDEEIQSILLSNDEAPAKSLVELAIKNGGEDNVTCVVIKSIV
jgi:protein phosphatase